MIDYSKYEKMKSRERVFAALKREEVDRKPVINPVSIANVELMKRCNTYFPYVHTNAEKMAALAATGYEILEFDTIAPYFSVQQEAAAFGCEIDWGKEDEMPDVKGCLYQTPDEIEIPKNFLGHIAIKTVIDSLKILKNKYNDEVALIGKVMGPWTLAYHLFGVQKFLMDTILAPDMVNEILERLKEVTIKFANAQFEAGADLVTLADHATGDLISAKCYAKFLKSIHQEITSRVNGRLILHICGRTIDRMPDIADTGFKVFHFESKNNPQEAKKAVGNKIILAGNIDNIKVLLFGTPDDVKKAVFENINAGIEMISPECAVPLTTSISNLQAIVAAVREYYFMSDGSLSH